MIQIKIIQYLKHDIKDPEGAVVLKSLQRLNYPVTEFHIGREMWLDIDVDDIDEAKRLASEMCERILTNPILHSYKIEVIQ